ncbi:MAG: cysteine--tRNA ligase [Elusimicrobiales bacterium]|nr:cysteine--tRNA ligase [Elusimicrobiales bacterium]
MKFFLYNTMTREKGEFKPMNTEEVTIYTCGPTVYHYAHIGNMRTYIMEDALVRSLRFCGYGVKRCMNITDVGHLVSDGDEGEDKIEAGARREGKSAWEIASFYSEAFMKDYKALNCLQPEVLCPATEYIAEMIKLGVVLEKKGYAYATSDGIYFDTSKLPDYGKLAGRKHIEGIQEGHRVAVNSEKRNAADFAIWKFSPKDQKRQMEWHSPWGIGFPGWHMECSAMAMKNLGETIDIHCGGEDHIAVHHTNEIAQSEAATGKPFANYWMHIHFLIMREGETVGKMSKSKGSFLTVATLPKEYEPLAYRYYCLQTHYRKQLEFTWEGLKAAQQGLNGLRALAIKAKKEAGKPAELQSDAPYLVSFAEAIADDLNMSAALAVAWKTLKDSSLASAEKYAFAIAVENVLALDLFKEEELPQEESLPDEIMSIIKEREDARKAKDWKKSDELRAVLLEKGIIVKDTPKGTEWSKA